MFVVRTQKRKCKEKENGKKKEKRKKNRKIKKGNYNTYHEPQPQEWIERRS